MKKIFGIIALAVMLCLPLSVAKASTGINYKCTDEANDMKTCTITYDIKTTAETSLSVKLTEHGGAEIQQSSITNAADSDWTVDNATELSNVWTVSLSSLKPEGITGTGNLFTFKYKKSSSPDCKVTIALGDKVIEETPNDPEPTTPEPTTPDTPEENKQTGATLPYIALGTIAVVSVGVYVAIKNKSKMYKL